MNYKYIHEQSDVSSLLPILMSVPAWGLDVETTGLDPHKDKVVLLQLGTPGIQFILDTRKVQIEPLRPFFESKKIVKVGHNLKFDYKMIKGSFGIDVERLADTYLAEILLTIGIQFGGFGLDDVLKKYFRIDLPKDERSTFGKGFVPKEDFTSSQLAYAARDVEHLVPLTMHLQKLMGDERLDRTFELECCAIPCFGDMEFAGVVLDKQRWQGLIDENQRAMGELIKELNGYAKNFVQEDLFGDIHVNWESPEQVVNILKSMGVRVSRWDKDKRKEVLELITKSDDKTLKKVKDYPVIKALKKYRAHSIRVKTFGKSYLDAISPVTGRLHPDISQIGTETGRPANRTKKGSVNFLNIPRDKAYRSCFRGEENEVVETDDYSGCELRIWAELSQDPGLLEAFNRGIDVHCHVASKLFGKNVTKKDPERTPAKTLNFGIAYGMSPFSFTEKLNGDGWPMSIEEGKRLFYTYEEDFETGIKFLRDAGKRALEEGKLRNISGRIRHWFIPDPNDAEKYPTGADDSTYIGKCSAIKREGGNFLIQSVNADMTKLAMIYIREYKKKNKVRTEFMNQVYDEIVTRTHIDDSPDFHEAKKRFMLKAAENYLKTVPMEVEGTVGGSWTK